MDLLSASASKSLFDQFLAERRYLKNVTPDTIDWYQTAYKAFQRALGSKSPDITKQSLQRFVVSMRERGVKSITCNTYIKAINAFCRWLHQEGHLAEPLRLGLLKTELRVIPTLTDAEVRALLTFKPKS